MGYFAAVTGTAADVPRAVVAALPWRAPSPESGLPANGVDAGAQDPVDSFAPGLAEPGSEPPAWPEVREPETGAGPEPGGDAGTRPVAVPEPPPLVVGEGQRPPAGVDVYGPVAAESAVPARQGGPAPAAARARLSASARGVAPADDQAITALGPAALGVEGDISRRRVIGSERTPGVIRPVRRPSPLPRAEAAASAEPAGARATRRRPDIQLPAGRYPSELATGTPQDARRWLARNPDVVLPDEPNVTVMIDRVVFEQPPAAAPEPAARERLAPRGFTDYDELRKR
jgi:hypothetical protein